MERRKNPAYGQEQQKPPRQGDKPSGTMDDRDNHEIHGPHGRLQQVVVRDVKMNFGSMVVFMVKWVLASIPAMIILTLISLLIGMITRGIFSALLAR
jgi:hypothetical protein